MWDKVVGDDGEAESGDDEPPERTAADDAFIDDDGVGPARYLLATPSNAFQLSFVHGGPGRKPGASLYTRTHLSVSLPPLFGH